MASLNRLLLVCLTATIPASALADGETRFRISYPTAAHQGPLTGRAYVILSRTNEKEAERIRRMAEHVLASRPEGEPHPWWEFATAVQ